MPIVQFPRGYLVNTPLPEQVRCGVITQDMDGLQTVHTVEVVPNSASGTGQSWVPWKGALSFVGVL